MLHSSITRRYRSCPKTQAEPTLAVDVVFENTLYGPRSCVSQVVSGMKISLMTTFPKPDIQRFLVGN